MNQTRLETRLDFTVLDYALLYSSLPTVSIVVPFFGLTIIIVRIL